MAAELLKSTRKTLRHAGLQGLLNTTILPAISLEDGFVRDLAIQCLGLYGLLDKDVAKAHLLIFLQVAAATQCTVWCSHSSIVTQVINNDRNQVQLTALRCLLDFLMIFDGLLDTPTADEERKEDAASLPSMGSVISTLAGYLVSDDVPDTHRNCVVEGLVKLMLFDRFQDDSILSLLFLLYVNPQTADNTHLRQCLSVFFPAFASSSRWDSSIFCVCSLTHCVAEATRVRLQLCFSTRSKLSWRRLGHRLSTRCRHTSLRST